ncbi:Hypothetical protein NocV09_04600020 [Nannochloropsis oceanica]
MATQDVAAASIAIANALPCQYDESAVPDDQNEQADGMQQADGMEEEDGIEEEDSDVVVMEQEDNASVNSTINSSITASSNSSAKSRRRLSLSTINGKRKAFGVERRIDLSINYLYTFVSTLLSLWVRSCLEEYNLASGDFVGSVTDHGSDVKRCCTAGDCLDFKHEWCSPHMFSRAIVEGVEYSEAREDTANENGRKLLMEVRKMITHISKRGRALMKAVFDESQTELFGKSLKLTNMAMQRWSSTERTLYLALGDWRAILRTYHVRSKRVQLGKKRQELVELYSLFYRVNLLLKDSQGSSVTSGPLLVMRVILLLQNELALDKPLIVIDPAVVEKKDEAVDLEERGAGPVLPRGHTAVRAAALTDVGTKSRRLLRESIIKRFVKSRYHSTGDCGKPSYLVDAAALAHPGLMKMKWVDKMADSKGHATLVESKIEDVIIVMLEELHFNKWLGVGGGEEFEDENISSQPPKRTLPEYRKATTSDIAAMMSDDEDDCQAVASGPMTSYAWARAKLVEFFDWCGGKGDKVDIAKKMQWKDISSWWLMTGSGMFPELAQIFQALLSMPRGAASLGRDFSIASNVLTVHCAQLDQAFVEMTMLQNMNIDKIPPLSDIRELTVTEAKEVMPRRLRNKDDFQKFLHLDESVTKEGEKEDDAEAEENDKQATETTRYGANDGADDDEIDDGYDDNDDDDDGDA